MLEILAVIFAIVVAYYLFKSNKNNGKLPLPPGPFRWPIVGHMFSVGQYLPHLVIDKWSKKYGNIMALDFGPAFKTTIIISDAKLIKEAFNHPNLNGRPDVISFNAPSGGKHGIIMSDGPTWLEQRRFTLRHLRDFGFGKNSMETIIQEELHDLLEGFQSNVGKPLEINRRFSLAVLNTIWGIITGKRFKHDDPKFTELLNRSQEVFSESAVNPILLFFPSLAELLPGLTGFGKFMGVIGELNSVFVASIVEHKKTIQEDNPRDLIDSYLDEIRKTTDKNSSFYKEAGEKSLTAVISDMFQAGSETTSVTLSWLVLYLIQNPRVQLKLKEEIDRVTGKTRGPTLADRPNMPFAEATILEVLRITSIAANGLFHQAMADTEFHGFLIPEGANLMPNLYGSHHDPDVWGDPEQFRPERFITEEGQCNRKHDRLQPFSIGKRVCLGESLARDSLFLISTGIIQRFQIVLDPAGPKLDLEPKPGFLQAPKTYHVVLTERN